MGRELGEAAGRGSGRTRLLRALEQGGYEPITDTHGTIRLRNCPFDALAEAHRTLVCGTNLAMADGMLAGIGAIGMKPTLDRQPGFCCVAFRDSSTQDSDPSSRRGTVPATAIASTRSMPSGSRARHAAGWIVPHERLAARVWGREEPADRDSLRVFVRRLRSKLADDAANPRYVETVRGVGYRLLPGD